MLIAVEIPPSARPPSSRSLPVHVSSLPFPLPSRQRTAQLDHLGMLTEVSPHVHEKFGQGLEKQQAVGEPGGDPSDMESSVKYCEIGGGGVGGGGG